MAKQTILTEDGLKKLEHELEVLKTVRRKEVSEKIKTALSFGDLSENSEYDEAKNEQGLIEAQIAEIEQTLMNVKILDEDELSTEVVNVGNKLDVKNLKTGALMKLHIVGSQEVDVKKGKISDESPMGAALLGHAVGSVVEFETPGGIQKFEIIDITK
ncbi:MAG: transcription elongation factor GreA [Clostridiales bacterium]|nr:transcription elongation factor GreA [Clostridiales bacterium]